MKKIKILLCLLSFLVIIPINIYASSGSISVSSSTSQIVVGKTFTVTVKISSSSALGSWEWTIDYDKNKFKLQSGTSNVVDYGNGSTKSKSYTYTFKAIATGSGKIGIKSYGAYTWDEKRLSINAGSKTVKVISQSELQASYSKNNNLSSLSVNDYTLVPSFDKDINEYKVSVSANTEEIEIIAKKEDSKASISGSGKKNVDEGDNKFEIVVTAENGSTKTYTIIVTVNDPNPIEVNLLDDKYTVVKRESNLVAPNNYEKTTIKINEQDIPGFYNELNKYTLVGLKNSEGKINLYIYDDGNYTLYEEVILNQVKILPLLINKEIDGYTKSKINIGENEYECLNKNNSDYYIIYARNIETGLDDYYLYDSKLNTLITYDDTDSKIFNDKINKYYKIIISLLSESLLLLIIVIGMLCSNLKRKRKAKKRKEEKLALDNEKINTQKKKNENIKEKKIVNDKLEDKKEKLNEEKEDIDTIIIKNKKNNRKKRSI